MMISILPIEIKCKIFTFLRVKDLLSASMVCKEWYDVIGKCQKCMSKIWLVLYYPNKKNIQYLINTTRRYENCKVSNLTGSDAQLEFLFQSKIRWKRIFIRMNYLYAKHFTNFIERLSKDLEEIEIWHCDILENTKIDSELLPEFPKLKNLIAGNICNSAMKMFVKYHKSLLSLQFLELQLPSTTESIREIIQLNPQLTTLELHGYFNVFQQRISEDIKLKRFFLFVPNSVTDNAIIENLRAFLYTQSQHAENITISGLHDMELRNLFVNHRNICFIH